MEAATGATSNYEILRRMSLTGSDLHKQESLANVDPRAANPILDLNEGVISATFCISHFSKLQKGARLGRSILSPHCIMLTK